MGNLVNHRGVPLAAQRSDDWLLEETPVKVAIPENMTPEATRNYVGNQLRKILERDDLERRLKDAEAAIAELKPALEKAQGAVEADSPARK